MVVALVFLVHGLLLSAVCGGLAASLAALLEAEEGKETDEEGASCCAAGVDGGLGGIWEFFKFLGNGLLWWLWLGEETDLLGGVSSV